ncbi:hypothetical protein [Streptomyces sp. NBC_00306]|uniref:hypothetical protein n=1 Tax=Streptomyces sp. NBC_00306 TaxID=2975708 RepID=UPI002E2C705D|nr:hypothetical protein [Streptomyces sp. NBC_00306]
MSADGNETAAGDAATTHGFMALPGRTEDGREVFARSLVDVVRILGLDAGLLAEPEPEPGGRRTWVQHIRTALRSACLRGLTLSEESFDTLVRAAVHDPDPSFNRQFVEPALNAFGQRRVQSALLAYLKAGTDHERAGAARAWYWSALPPRMPRVRAQNPGAIGKPEPADRAGVVAEWNETALREFVSNEHVDVRRCILPGLSLRKSAYPAEFHSLVDAAVAIARSHPDDYIRHRVEHQVGD